MSETATPAATLYLLKPILASSEFVSQPTLGRLSIPVVALLRIGDLPRTLLLKLSEKLRGACSRTLRAAKVGLFGFFTLRIQATYTVGALLVLLVGHLSENGYRTPETADHPGQSHNNDDAHSR